jgi:hypothetical protein
MGIRPPLFKPLVINMIHRLPAAMAALCTALMFATSGSAVEVTLSEQSSSATPETIAAPAPLTAGANSADGFVSDSDWSSSANSVHIFSAVLETRRYGPVEEPEPEFYALRNLCEPGFDWTPGLLGGGFGNWGFGGWGNGGWGFGGWRGPALGFGFRFPTYGFGTVGYNRYYYRPWYSYPAPFVWSNKFPWYSPGGIGPNIYQPWYLTRNSVPWYSPIGAGPNIYTPTYSWRANYPWYSPNGPGPNIYTPQWQYGGCLYW